MRKKVFKIFAEWQFEKEEKWLNEMADKGWKLVEVGFGTYTFESCEPSEYTIRAQMLEQSYKDKRSRDYISFIEEQAQSLPADSGLQYISERRDQRVNSSFSPTTPHVSSI